jgi:thioredoxin-related protein
MKRLIVLLTVIFLGLGSLHAAGATWLTDYEAAKKLAASEKKSLLLDFTGSDWCGWCIRLDKEVFSQPEFVDYAAKNLVLVKLDFPRTKEISAAEKKQNEALAQKHQIRGFPTIVVLDSKAQTLGQLGYQRGGAASWLASLENITSGK